MRYLRWIIAVLFLVSGGVALGQKETKASIMKKAFNDIRVEMVLDACKIMGYENTELMDRYRSEKNLDVFHKAMGKEKEDDKGNKQLEYLWLIIGEANTNVTLDGESLAGYQESITNFRTQLKEAYDGKNGNRLSCFKSFLNNKLVEEKKDEVNSNNEKYKRKIDVLIADCRLYEAAERSREWQAYIETNGVFVELAKSQKKEKDVFDKISILTQAKDTAQCDVFIKNNPMSVYLSEVKLKRNELKNLVKYEQFVIDGNEFLWERNNKKYSTTCRDTCSIGNDVYVLILTINPQTKQNSHQKPDSNNHVNASDAEEHNNQQEEIQETVVHNEQTQSIQLKQNNEEFSVTTDTASLEENHVNGGGGSGNDGTGNEILALLQKHWYIIVAIALVVLLIVIILLKRKKNHSQQYTNADNEATQREENAAYERCTTVSACEYYLNTYPNGRFVKEVIAKKAGLLEQMQKEEDTAFEKCTTITACEFYLIKYPKGKYVNEVKDKLAKLKENKEKPKPKPYPKQGEWVVVGASVKGNGHIQSNMPCQDNNKFELLGKGWGVAIVSDGAGSAAHSDMGSKVVVERGLVHFKNLIEKEGWMEKNILPSDAEWLQKSYFVLKTIRNEVEMVAKKNNVDVKSLSATCLAVVFSPMGLLVVHVGDGRMGCKTMSGEWKAIMTPHKGEEANQTLFLVSDFWNIPNYVQSGVLVPESLVVKEPVEAFALMSDGCESTAWLCTTQNAETGKYYDQNKPFAGFFNPLEETLVSFHKEQVPEEERKEKWYKFIESGTKGFVKEQDDKTMILGVFCGK